MHTLTNMTQRQQAQFAEIQRQLATGQKTDYWRRMLDKLMQQVKEGKL